MATRRRGRRKESKHDEKVRKEALKLRRKGWRVKAAVSGFRLPKPIGKRKKVPDIEATKGGATKLIEVETRASVGKDKKQQSVFRRSASQRNRTIFELKVV